MKKTDARLRMILISLVILIFDQISKYCVMNILDDSSINLILFRFTLVQNTGSVFGLPIPNLILIAISVIVIVSVMFLIWKNRIPDNRFAQFGTALILAGTCGNLIDRVLFGHVRDFIDLRFWPIFNLADAGLSVGIALLIIYFITIERTTERKGQ